MAAVQRHADGLARLVVLLLWVLLPATTLAAGISGPYFSTFAAGDGPSHGNADYHLLDGKDTPGQSNAVAFDLMQAGAFEQLTLHCRLRVLAGGDGGAFLFLNTAEYGQRGPAPFVKDWTVPNLRKSFAVGIDVHDPSGPKQPNYQGRPEREVSLHWDGHEIVKRVAPAEFRGDFHNCEIGVHYVLGGAEISVRLAGAAVYDHYFLPGMAPYETRLAIGAGTGAEVSTRFDVRDLDFTVSDPAPPNRRPAHFTLFNHVVTDNEQTFRTKEVMLPPLDWAYGRVLLTLEIHDNGLTWDEWDQYGHLYLVDPAGVKRDIVPFITSFRTPCFWQVDVTRFRPWLAGKVTFELSAGNAAHKNRGYMLSAALDFYHGLPNPEPYRVIPLWNGTARYRSAANHYRDFFTPKTVRIDPETKAAQLFLAVTGHSPIGEFTPSARTLIFNPEQGKPTGIKRFSNILWKNDNYLNPNRPQFGSWQYARAGWGPGDIVRPWQIDLTGSIAPGKTAELRYEPQAYNLSAAPAGQQPTEDQISQAVQIVNTYLVLYRAPTGLRPAPTLQVIGVEKGSNAAGAGIQTGDYLESYNGRRRATIEKLRAAIRAAQAAGRKHVKAVIYRGDKRLEVELGPGRMGVNLLEQ